MSNKDIADLQHVVDHMATSPVAVLAEAEKTFDPKGELSFDDHFLTCILMLTPEQQANCLEYKATVKHACTYASDTHKVFEQETSTGSKAYSACSLQPDNKTTFTTPEDISL